MRIVNRQDTSRGRACRWLGNLCFVLLVCFPASRSVPQERIPAGDEWRDNLRKVHARFSGRKGTFAEFGDSITATMAFWTPLLYAHRNGSPAIEKACETVKAYQLAECWRDWKGPEYGNEGGQTTEWALKNIDGWLKRLNPEVAVVLFGTNDLRTIEADAYKRNLRSIVQRCLDNGTEVLLTTIPPRHGLEGKASAFADAARQVAREASVPLLDFHAAVLERRPADWDGALSPFSAYKDYDVPTLIARDGVHPSNPQKYQNDYSAEALRSCGYSLRNYLTALGYAAVIDALRSPAGGAGRLSAQRPPNAAVTDALRTPAGGAGSPGSERPSNASAVDALRPPSGGAGRLSAQTPSNQGGVNTRPTPVEAKGGVKRVRADTSGTAIHPPEQPWFPKAPGLPPPTGEILIAATVDELYAAVEHVRPGGTVLLADGFYGIKAPLEIKTNGVSLRGASGRRERVLLDAGNRGELLRVTGCSGVTIANLTVQNVQWNGIKINSETGVQRLTIYNCLLHNIWQRAVKGVKVPDQDREKVRPTGFRIQYCLFYNDRPKQFADDPSDTDQTFHGNYIGGIDTMFPRDWTISDNVFVGIHGKTGEARGAVFLWHDARNCIVERNIIIDCDSGICLGNSSRPDDIAVHCTGCIVRNNFVTRCPENGILADYTKDCRILNNTVCDPTSRLGRLIRLVHDNDGLVVANNLVCGPPIRVETQSKIVFRANLEKNIAAALVDAANGNLHLTDRAVDAIGRGVALPEVRADIDRTPRGGAPDIGADELHR